MVLADENEQSNPKIIGKLIQENNIDMIQMTPSRMQILFYFDKELTCLKNIKTIMLGGEAFPYKLLKALQEKTTAQLYNLYGPTETTIWSTISNLTNDKIVHIGKPIKNTKVYIIDEQYNEVLYGEAGELYIEGIGLAKGYINRDDLTREKFVILPKISNSTLYRTGDYVRYLPDGNLEFIGRIDNQVKIRGYRIELEEIEKRVSLFVGVLQAVASVYTNENDSIICLHYTSDVEVDEQIIKKFISEKLPEYMVPNLLFRVSQFDYTPNGKINRKELKYEKNTNDVSMIIMDNIEKETISILFQIIDNLNIQITKQSNLSSIGIDSVSFVSMAVNLEEKFNFEFDDEMLSYIAIKTVGDLIEYVKFKIN